jgi:hypothetical protein
VRGWLIGALAAIVVGVPLTIAIVKAPERGAMTYLVVGLPVLGLLAGIGLLTRTASASGRGRWPSGARRVHGDEEGPSDGAN